MKIVTYFVLNSDLEVTEEVAFEYHGPVATCTGAEEAAVAEPAIESAAKGAGDAAAAGGAEAAGAAAAAPEVAGALDAGAGAGLADLGAGTLALTDAGGLGAGASGATLPGLDAGVSAIEGAGVGAPAAAELAPQVGAGAADIAGGDVATDAASIAGDVGLAPPAAPTSIGAPVTDLSTATNLAPITDLSTPAAGAPGIGSKLLSQLTGNPSVAGALGLNLASGIAQQRAGKDAASQLKAAAAPFNQTGQDLLAQYKSGKLNPGDEFKINQWQQEQIAKIKSQMGGNSTASRNAVAQIESQAQAMRDQARQGLLTQGLNALGMGTGPLTSAIQAQAQQDQALQQASGSALNSLLLLSALSKGGAG